MPAEAISTQAPGSRTDPGSTGATVPADPLLLTAAQAAALCSTSERTWRLWDIAGKTPPPDCIGRKVFWRPDELRDWVAAGCPDRETWKALRE